MVSQIDEVIQRRLIILPRTLGPLRSPWKTEFSDIEHQRIFDITKTARNIDYPKSQGK